MVIRQYNDTRLIFSFFYNSLNKVNLVSHFSRPVCSFSTPSFLALLIQPWKFRFLFSSHVGRFMIYLVPHFPVLHFQSTLCTCEICSSSICYHRTVKQSGYVTASKAPCVLLHGRTKTRLCQTSWKARRNAGVRVCLHICILDIAVPITSVLDVG